MDIVRDSAESIFKLKGFKNRQSSADVSLCVFVNPLA